MKPAGRTNKGRCVRSVAIAVLPLVVSCNLLTPVIFIGEHKKRIAPEFDKLAGQRVAIHVWADPSTLFDYPHVRFELATYVGNKLFTEMTRRNLGTTVVDSRAVEELLQKDPDARIDPRAVGKAFDVDYVIYLEVLRFQMRDPEQPQFLRGVIEASVTVHDMAADPDQVRQYELTPVQVVYPDSGPVLLQATNAPLIREGAYYKFAETVARKFYEHTVDL